MSFIPVQTHEELQDVLKRVISSKNAITERIIAEKIGEADIAEQVRRFQAPTVDAIARHGELGGEQHEALLQRLQDTHTQLTATLGSMKQSTRDNIKNVTAAITGTNKRLDTITDLTELLANISQTQLTELRDRFKDNNEALRAIELAIQLQSDQQSAQNMIKSTLDASMHDAFDAMENGKSSTKARRSDTVSTRGTIGATGKEAQITVRRSPSDQKILVLTVSTKSNRFIYPFTKGLAYLLYQPGEEFDPYRHPITADDALSYLDIVRQGGLSTSVTSNKVTHIRSAFEKDLLAAAGAADVNDPKFKKLWSKGPTAFAQANGIDPAKVTPFLEASLDPNIKPDPVPTPSPPPDPSRPPPPDVPAELHGAWQTVVNNASVPNKEALDVRSSAGSAAGSINREPIMWTTDGNRDVLQLEVNSRKTNYDITPGLVALLYTPDNQWATADKSDVTFDDTMMYLDIIKQAGHQAAKSEKFKWVRENTEDTVKSMGQWTTQDLDRFYRHGPRSVPNIDLDQYLKPSLVRGGNIFNKITNAVQNALLPGLSRLIPQKGGAVIAEEFEGGAAKGRKKKKTAVAYETDPTISLRPPKINKQALAAMQKLRNAYKVQPLGNGWGQFGQVYIDLEKLNKHPSKLVARGSGGDKLMKLDAHSDLSELLFKRFNPRKKYDGGAVDVFRRLVDLSGLPAAPSSGKYKLITGGQTENIIAPEFPYDLSQLSQPVPLPRPQIITGGNTNTAFDRLGILLGNLAAGGNSPEVFNEALEIINTLRNQELITDDYFRQLLAKLRNLISM